jgi:hypothetical protein
VDACVVESEIGTVEASLAGQVGILRNALSVVFERSELSAEESADEVEFNQESQEDPSDKSELRQGDDQERT